MSEKTNDFKTENEKLINEFLSDVEKKLPFWLRAKEETVEEILEELENHIWDRATEIAEGADPSSRDILTSIAQMGTPSKIANEYKRRGKPKFFITEELWDSYTRALIIIGSIVLVINLIIMFVGIGQKNVGALFDDFFNGLFISAAVTFILLTVQFVYLSKEGYLPEDFRRFTESRVPSVHDKIFTKDKTPTTKADPYKKVDSSKAVPSEKYSQPVTPLEKTKVPTRTGATYPTDNAWQPSKAQKEEYSEKFYIPSKIKKEYRKERAKKQKKKPKSHFLGRNYLSEGIAGIIFGVLIIILPFLPVLDFLGMPIELKAWIAISGSLTVVLGLIRFVQGLIGRMARLQQALILLSMVPQALNIPLYIAVKDRPAILISYLQTKLAAYATPHTIWLIVTIVAWVLIGGTIIGLIAELVRVIRLEVAGFEPYNQ